ASSDALSRALELPFALEDCTKRAWASQNVAAVSIRDSRRSSDPSISPLPFRRSSKQARTAPLKPAHWIGYDLNSVWCNGICGRRRLSHFRKESVAMKLPISEGLPR